jgi:hypothetical protein
VVVVSFAKVCALHRTYLRSVPNLRERSEPGQPVAPMHVFDEQLLKRNQSASFQREKEAK